MSEDREQAGSPVEQTEATDTQVLAAVERAAEVSAPTDAAATDAADVTDAAEAASVASETASKGESERPVIAAATEPPSAGKLETAEEIFAAHPGRANAEPRETAATEVAAAAAAATERPAATTSLSEEGLAAVSARASESASDAGLPPVRDGEIRISADHPMAALYMQSPMPPEIKGNRGAGLLIALLATIGFALVYAGVLALWLAPTFPPSTFLDQGLLPWIMNWGFAAAAIGFFVGFALLVLIVGRAGWWSYVLGGLLVAAFTWAVAIVGFALDERFSGMTVSLQPLNLLSEYGLFFPVIAAGLVAREVSVWFGAWIGARGRKVKRQNAQALAEYETALAEVQAKQP